MRRSVWFPVVGFPLIASLLVFAYSIYADKTQMLGPLQASLLLAFGLNGSIGVTIGFLSAWYKWVSTRDSAECVALFGLKVGVTVFVLISLISIVLKVCKQPPTFAAYGLVVVPFHAFEIASCILEPIVFVWEACESCSNSIRNWRERRSWRRK
jgi:hypothetical protein